jgi:hypothetical protein
MAAQQTVHSPMHTESTRFVNREPRKPGAGWQTPIPRLSDPGSLNHDMELPSKMSDRGRTKRVERNCNGTVKPKPFQQRR